MTVDKSKRRRSGENSQVSHGEIETKFAELLVNLEELKSKAAQTGLDMNEKCLRLSERLKSATAEVNQLRQEVNEKELRESLHLSQIYEEKFTKDMDALIRDKITVPESKIRLFWEYLKLRVDPAPIGGVLVTIGFPHSSRLPDLRFVLQFSQAEQYGVTDCDPMIIGLSELVAQLNNDKRAGALARFCCRLRARYTAQYSTEY